MHTVCFLCSRSALLLRALSCCSSFPVTFPSKSSNTSYGDVTIMTVNGIDIIGAEFWGQRSGASLSKISKRNGKRSRDGLHHLEVSKVMHIYFVLLKTYLYHLHQRFQGSSQQNKHITSIHSKPGNDYKVPQ